MVFGLVMFNWIVSIIIVKVFYDLFVGFIYFGQFVDYDFFYFIDEDIFFDGFGKLIQKMCLMLDLYGFYSYVLVQFDVLCNIMLGVFVLQFLGVNDVNIIVWDMFCDVEGFVLIGDVCNDENFLFFQFYIFML